MKKFDRNCGGKLLGIVGAMDYQKRGKGCEGDGAEPASVGVGYEGADQRGEVGDAGPDVDDVGGHHLVHAINPDQVHHEVR